MNKVKQFYLRFFNKTRITYVIISILLLLILILLLELPFYEKLILALIICTTTISFTIFNKINNIKSELIHIGLFILSGATIFILIDKSIEDYNFSINKIIPLNENIISQNEYRFFKNKNDKYYSDKSFLQNIGFEVEEADFLVSKYIDIIPKLKNKDGKKYLTEKDYKSLRYKKDNKGKLLLNNIGRPNKKSEYENKIKIFDFKGKKKITDLDKEFLKKHLNKFIFIGFEGDSVRAKMRAYINNYYTDFNKIYGDRNQIRHLYKYKMYINSSSDKGKKYYYNKNYGRFININSLNNYRKRSSFKEKTKLNCSNYYCERVFIKNKYYLDNFNESILNAPLFILKKNNQSTINLDNYEVKKLAFLKTKSYGTPNKYYNSLFSPYYKSSRPYIILLIILLVRYLLIFFKKIKSYTNHFFRLIRIKSKKIFANIYKNSKRNNTRKKKKSKPKEEGAIIDNSEWTSNGSGLFISKSGYIVTNYHVIENNTSIEVEFIFEKKITNYTAKVISFDKTNDLAILKVNDKKFENLKHIPYSIKKVTIDVGTNVFALGYPMALALMGKEIKFSDGKISSKTGIDGNITTYQISTPILPGNSGGPLFDYEGNLIGINSSGLARQGYETVGYSIKVNYLLSLIDLLPEKIKLPSKNNIKSKPLTEQIKILSEFVVLIKVK